MPSQPWRSCHGVLNRSHQLTNDESLNQEPQIKTHIFYLKGGLEEMKLNEPREAKIRVPQFPAAGGCAGVYLNKDTNSSLAQIHSQRKLCGFNVYRVAKETCILLLVHALYTFMTKVLKLSSTWLIFIITLFSVNQYGVLSEYFKNKTISSLSNCVQ